MQKSNLIVYFRQLSKRDWREFKKFVRSPYHNQREDVIRLFDYLEPAVRNLSRDFLDREKVFNAIYPQEVFDEKNFGIQRRYF